MSNAGLTTTDHSRDSAGLRYVYPVVSRRAGGVSIGINLNPNNACNWRCIYCQVPELVRGTAPPIDLALLEQELSGFLHELQHGDFMQRRAAGDAAHQRHRDVRQRRADHGAGIRRGGRPDWAATSRPGSSWC